MTNCNWRYDVKTRSWKSCTTLSAAGLSTFWKVVIGIPRSYYNYFIINTMHIGLRTRLWSLRWRRTRRYSYYFTRSSLSSSFASPVARETDIRDRSCDIPCCRYRWWVGPCAQRNDIWTSLRPSWKWLFLCKYKSLW